MRKKLFEVFVTTACTTASALLMTKVINKYWDRVHSESEEGVSEVRESFRTRRRL